MKNRLNLVREVILASVLFSFAGVDGGENLVIHHVDTQVIDSDFIKDGRVYFGPDIFWTNENPHIGGVRVKDESVYYGLRFGYDYFKPNRIYGGIDALWAFGRTRFDAKTKIEDLYKNTVPTSFANLEGRLGYNFYSPESLYFSPYLGVGGYYIKPFKSVHYTEMWWYGAAGIKMNYVATPIFTVGIDAKFMKTFYIEQHIQKRKISKHYRNAGDIIGYGISVPLSWKIGEAREWDIQLEPYYSKLNTKSDLNVIGTRLTFGYQF